MVNAKVKIGLPILVGGTIGVYYNASGKYVQSSTGEYINNSQLYKILNASNTFTESKKWYEEKINNSYLNLRGNQVDHNKGMEQIKTIEDYSIRISSDCSSGTAWFLDYAIPENGGYPTKWFIATNAHVISQYKFKDNPFDQQLPVEDSWFNFGRYCRGSNGNDHTTVYLTKEIGNDSKVLDLERDHVLYDYKYRYPIRHSVYDSVRQIAIENPKLFYVPINFLGSRWNWSNFIQGRRSDYYKDFAVLEVNFHSPEAAKIMTNNFFEKRKNNTTKELDLLNFSLLKNKSGDDLIRDQEKYFVAGYPGDSKSPLSIFGNYSQINQTASKIASWNYDDFSIKNKYGESLIGLADAGKIDDYRSETVTNWNNRDIMEWGYNYVIDNVKLGQGSSGSLVTNSKGEVLGLYRMHSRRGTMDTGTGFVEPLRSEGLIENGKIVFPKYDLIQGTEGQIGSYKEQLEKYYPNLKTYLKSKWESQK